MTTLELRPDEARSAATDPLEASIGEQIAELASALPAGTDGDALRAALAEAVVGGKRFRPRLVADIHRALAGAGDAPGTEAVALVCAGVELLHTAFVVHDDVIDGDDVRRGAPSVPGRFRLQALAEGVPDRAAATRAVAGAVLTGDLALVLAMRAFALAPVTPAVRARLLGLATEAIAISAAGELADVRLSSGRVRPTGADALTVAERKTAWYSFALPLQLGGVLAGADDDVLAALAEAGLLLGTAFQVYDDIAGTFGDASATGKSTLADLREGKATLLIAHARKTPWWPMVALSWGNPDLTEDEAAVARSTLEQSGSRRYAEAIAANHLVVGLARLEDAGVDRRTMAWMADLSPRARTGAA